MVLQAFMYRSVLLELLKLRVLQDKHKSKGVTVFLPLPLAYRRKTKGRSDVKIEEIYILKGVYGPHVIVYE